eukprot:g11414.t1
MPAPPMKKQKTLQRRPSEALHDAKQELRRKLRLYVSDQPDAVEEALASLLSRHENDIAAAFEDKRSQELEIVTEFGNKIQSRGRAKADDSKKNTKTRPTKKKSPKLPKEMADCSYARPMMAGYISFLQRTPPEKLEAYDADLFTGIQMEAMDVCEKCTAPASIQAVLKVMCLEKQVPGRFLKIFKACKYQLLANLWGKESATIKETYDSIRTTIVDDDEDEYLRWSGRVADGVTGVEAGPEEPKEGKKKVLAFLQAVNKKKNDMKKSSDSRATQKELYDVTTGVDDAQLSGDITIPHGVTSVDFVTQACAGDWQTNWKIGETVDDFATILSRLKTLEEASAENPTLNAARKKAIDPIERVVKYCTGTVATVVKPTGLPTQSALQGLLNRIMSKKEAARGNELSLLLNKATNVVKTGKAEEARKIGQDVEALKTYYDNMEPHILNSGAALLDKKRLEIARAAMKWIENPDFTKVALKCAITAEKKALERCPWTLSMKMVVFDKMQAPTLADLEKAEKDRISLCCDATLADKVATAVAALMYLDLNRVTQIMGRTKAIQRAAKASGQVGVDDWA